MASNAIAAYGTLLKRGAATSGSNTFSTYATIGEVKSIKGPSTEVSTIDVTTHSSAASGNYREFVPSLIDPGTIDVELSWVPSDSTHALLWTDLTGRTKRDFWIQTPANASGASANMQFAAYVTNFSKEFPTDDVQSATLTLKITGAITLNT